MAVPAIKELLRCGEGGERLFFFFFFYVLLVSLGKPNL